MSSRETPTGTKEAAARCLQTIREGDAAARLEAVRHSAELGSAGLAALGPLLGGDDPGAARAAREAMQRIVHHAARPGAEAERKAVSTELCRLTAETHSLPTRLEALRLLGMAGDAEAVPVIAACLNDPEVREEARAALERLPDRAAETALQKARSVVPAYYQPAIEQSLRHRRTRWRDKGTRV